MGVSKQFKDKVNKLTYDKPTFNSRLVQMQKSFEEVSKIISGKSSK